MKTGIVTTCREQRDWSEYQLAECVGLPRVTISSWYRKNMVPTFAANKRICEAFGITLSQLFSEDDALLLLHRLRSNCLSVGRD